MNDTLDWTEQETRRGIGALQAGDYAGARNALGKVAEAGGASPQVWLLLAQACEGLGDRDTGMAALDNVLKQDENNPFALLMKGDFFARSGNDRSANSFYAMALRRCAEFQHFPGDLKARLARAEAFLGEARRRFDRQLNATLANRGVGPLPPRFAEALAISRGDQPIYLQEPTNFYYPGLPQRPWYSRDEFPWVAEFEAAVPQIRAEAEAVLAGDSGLEPYVQKEENRAARAHSLMQDARWSAFHFFRKGERIEENAARCPVTMQLLDKAPVPVIAQRSPMALFSILQPGTHIPPHHGMLNTRLICHIPLIVPEGCRLRVGAETRPVIEGQAMIFDDSFEHEAWNDGSSARAILLFEIWRPELSESERTALTAMYEAVTSYDDEDEPS